MQTSSFVIQSYLPIHSAWLSVQLQGSPYELHLIIFGLQTIRNSTLFTKTEDRNF